jgi:hypothetical protein
VCLLRVFPPLFGVLRVLFEDVVSFAGRFHDAIWIPSSGRNALDVLWIGIYRIDLEGH